MKPFTDTDKGLHIILWVFVGLVVVWSGWHPTDRFTWVLEVTPIFIGTAILLSIYRHFYFSRLVCYMLVVHACILAVGGHFTYEHVPLFNWIRDVFHFSRNHYDRLGHFAQGFVPALLSREVLIRRGVIKQRAWLQFLVVCVCLAFSAFYELLEWQSAVWTGTKADAFLGSQGDVWDTQWDMSFALIGATVALLLMSRLHDKSINDLSRVGQSV
jgi:putative membrane protein